MPKLSGLEFAVDLLRHNPDATLDEVRERGRLENRRVHENTYVKARVELGLQKALPIAVRRPEPEPMALARGRPRRQTADDTGPDLAAFVASMEAVIEERDRLRGALHRIRDAVAAARHD
ncbi:MAG: hypothetical protein AAF628_32050 [Planctomycetota bacterium]